MKRILIALTVSILMVGLFVAPASASAPAGTLSANTCGMTYIVEGGDNLYKIAYKCGTTVPELLALNPQITDVSLIYTGQVLRMNKSADYGIALIDPVYWFFQYLSNLRTIASTGSAYTNYSNANVSLSVTQGEAGDNITITVSGFPAYTQIDYMISEKDQAYTDVYDGATDANGKASETISISAIAKTGEKWIVKVATTSGLVGVNAYSPTINIIDDGSSAEVLLSAREARAGDLITIYVSGFPALASIDYEIGRIGKKYSQVYDGIINSNGEATMIIAIPSEAKDGENWFVRVITTSEKDIVEDDSPVIHITN